MTQKEHIIASEIQLEHGTRWNMEFRLDISNKKINQISGKRRVILVR